jgi:general secretion pathway protein G
MRDSRRLRRARAAGDGGYTLTEMLVVIGIICLIAAVLTPAVLGQMSRARIKTAQLQLNTIAAEVEAFRTDVGRYPSGSEGLGALVAAPQGADGWAGPYAKARQLKDPWGHDLIYLPDQGGGAFKVESYGPTGKPGGTGADATLEAPD